MRRIILLLFFLMSFSCAYTKAQTEKTEKTYEIKYMNIPKIRVDNDSLKVGDKFKDSSTIYWDMEIDSLFIVARDNRCLTYYFYKYLFLESGAKTPKEYNRYIEYIRSGRNSVMSR